MDNLVDTLLNMGIFAFVGLMLWLYFKDVPTHETAINDEEQGP